MLEIDTPLADTDTPLFLTEAPPIMPGKIQQIEHTLHREIQLNNIKMNSENILKICILVCEDKYFVLDWEGDKFFCSLIGWGKVFLLCLDGVG